MVFSKVPNGTLQFANTFDRRFSGDESFSAPAASKGAALDAGTGLGVVIEGKQKERTFSNSSSASRL